MFVNEWQKYIRSKEGREGGGHIKAIIYLHQPMPFIFMNIDKVRKVSKGGKEFLFDS
jgi:hypothetical protein